MDPNRQLEIMKNLLLAEHTDEDDVHRTLCVGTNSCLHVAKLWDGIVLWANDIRLTKLSYPTDAYGTNDYLLVNICHSGRCEVELAQGGYVYMSPGILNVSASPPQSSYYYPGGTYGGIELCFNIAYLRDKMPEALTSYGFDYALLERYMSKKNMLASLTAAGVQEEERVFDMLRQKEVTVQQLRFAALSLLYHLTNGESTEITCSCLVSKGQRRIVTEAEQMMTDDLKRRFTIEEVASRFGISPSALKKYFASVYGRPISQYMREKRMEKAMELLVSTGNSVGDVAAVCGYEHQGKFGVAFKDYTGVSPLEYRRLNRKPTGN